MVKIIIQIEDVFWKDKDGKEHPFRLNIGCYYNFNEVAQCILASGYTFKSWEIEDDRNTKVEVDK